MRRAGQAVLVACATATALPAAAAPSFEELAREARSTTTLHEPVLPFVMDCMKEEPLGGVHLSTCQAMREALLKNAPKWTFLFHRDGADAVMVSPWDPRTRTLRLTVVGCLACKQPVEAVRGVQRFVTLKAPTKGPSGGPVAAELLRTTVALASPAAAEQWRKTTLPFLRVQLLFRVADQPWTIGSSEGYAFNPLGVRIYHRCTGEVLFSEPPSRGKAPQEAACTPAGPAEAEEPEDEPALPATLTSTAINEGLAAVRGELDACAKGSKTRGTATLVFQVLGSGLPETVTVQGSAAGTPLGECLRAAGMKAKFSAFKADKQQFKYPVPLRR